MKKKWSSKDDVFLIGLVLGVLLCMAVMCIIKYI